jgi:hypothetical protein
MIPKPTGTDPLSRVLNRIREALVSLTIQQTPDIRPNTTPRGTFLEFPPLENDAPTTPFFQPFRRINGAPYIIAPWHLGFVAPEVTVNAETGAKTRALPLEGPEQIMVAKIKIRWKATRRRLADKTPDYLVYPVEPWCAYYKCLFENPPEYDEEGNQLPSPCQPPDFSTNLVGTPIPQDPPPPRFYWTLEDPVLTDDVNASGTEWNGEQIRLITNPTIGWAGPNSTTQARWFFPVEMVASWDESANRVSANQIGELEQRLIPLEEGEEDDPDAPTLFYKDQTIQIPLLHAFQTRPGFYEIKTYGGPLSQIPAPPQSTAIEGAETVDANELWTRFHAETLITPRTTTINCDYAPPTEEGDPLIGSSGNHPLKPYWLDGENIEQRSTTNHTQDPKAYLVSNLQPSGQCATNPETGQLTGGRDTSQDVYLLDPYYEQSTDQTFFHEDPERPLTMRAPRAMAFPLPYQLGIGYKIPSVYGQIATNDQRPDPEPC